MDQDTHYMTREFLENNIVQLKDELALMTKFREELIQASNKTHDTLTRLQDNLKEWTRGELRSEDITVEQAQALAEIGDFTITQCYDVTIAVEHTFTVEIEAGEDIDDVLTSIDFTADSYHTTLDNTDYSVLEVNYEKCD